MKYLKKKKNLSIEVEDLLLMSSPKNFMKIKKNEILKLRSELSGNYKSLNSIKDIKSWYRNIIKKI